MARSVSLPDVGTLRATLGGYSPLARAYRRVRPRWLWRRTSPFGPSTSRYVNENGLTVRRGPFEGMTFIDQAVGKANHLSSKLIGSYEPDVANFLGEQAPEHELFVDLGSGEGFFCVGVARISPARVIGFELNRYERRLSERIAAANDVEFETRGEVDQSALNSLPPGRLLLLSDVEGLEEDLLDPEAVPRLREATMIVEVHEQYRPDVVTTLSDRFAPTHHLEHFSAGEPHPDDYPELAEWDRDEARWAAFDGHLPGQGWMSFVPR
jgi:hypothetical protein